MSAAPSNIEAVVIGASAGGVDALLKILPMLPGECRVAVLIVLHLPRDRPSLLAEVFSRRCRVPVCEAEDKQPILPGAVYFAPADYHLLVDEGPRIALSLDDLVHHSRPSIDVLFESAADVYGDRLAGVILTGANEDGAAGLAAVSERGGYTVVQEPESAQSPQMAWAALSAPRSRPVDAVLSLDGIARLFATLDGREQRSWSVRLDG